MIRQRPYRTRDIIYLFGIMAAFSYFVLAQYINNKLKPLGWDPPLYAGIANQIIHNNFSFMYWRYFSLTYFIVALMSHFLPLEKVISILIITLSAIYIIVVVFIINRLELTGMEKQLAYLMLIAYISSLSFTKILILPAQLFALTLINLIVYIDIIMVKDKTSKKHHIIHILLISMVALIHYFSLVYLIIYFVNSLVLTRIYFYHSVRKVNMFNLRYLVSKLNTILLNRSFIKLVYSTILFVLIYIIETKIFGLNFAPPYLLYEPLSPYEGIKKVILYNHFNILALLLSIILLLLPIIDRSMLSSQKHLRILVSYVYSCRVIPLIMYSLFIIALPVNTNNYAEYFTYSKLNFYLHVIARTLESVPIVFDLIILSFVIRNINRRIPKLLAELLIGSIVISSLLVVTYDNIVESKYKVYLRSYSDDEYFEFLSKTSIELNSSALRNGTIVMLLYNTPFLGLTYYYYSLMYISHITPFYGLPEYIVSLCTDDNTYKLAPTFTGNYPYPYYREVALYEIFKHIFLKNKACMYTELEIVLYKDAFKLRGLPRSSIIINTSFNEMKKLMNEKELAYNVYTANGKSYRVVMLKLLNSTTTLTPDQYFKLVIELKPKQFLGNSPIYTNILAIYVNEKDYMIWRAFVKLSQEKDTVVIYLHYQTALLRRDIYQVVESIGYNITEIIQEGKKRYGLPLLLLVYNTNVVNNLIAHELYKGVSLAKMLHDK